MKARTWPAWLSAPVRREARARVLVRNFAGALVGFAVALPATLLAVVGMLALVVCVGAIALWDLVTDALTEVDL